MHDKIGRFLCINKINNYRNTNRRHILPNSVASSLRIVGNVPQFFSSLFFLFYFISFYFMLVLCFLPLHKCKYINRKPKPPKILFHRSEVFYVFIATLAHVRVLFLLSSSSFRAVCVRWGVGRERGAGLWPFEAV